MHHQHAQRTAELERQLTETYCEVHKLKLEVLRWRKQWSLEHLEYKSAGEEGPRWLVPP
jgi:hypothetical protein